MNAVEIEEAISELAEQPFDAAEFPYAFLESFGNKKTTIKKLRSGASNKSDLGGVLQTNHIHMKVCEPGTVTDTLRALKESPATQHKRNRVSYILATDGIELEAENLGSGDSLACDFGDFSDHFDFFLALAGISYTTELKETKLDRTAARRLNKLYLELLKTNTDWGIVERRPDMNHFMARLIFCFFAEDTDIFSGTNLFTGTVEKMSAKDPSITHEVIGELFRAMNTRHEDWKGENIPRWVPDAIPYVNGGLFSGSTEVPVFSRIAQRYLFHIGGLDWQQINPDIFGSMIQTVADDDERGAVGMHYTSVPNILKVLHPLFLGDPNDPHEGSLRYQLKQAGDNSRKLLNLRNRISKIRVFDPACGSGNFLVIAYKQMREIEAEINKRRGEGDSRSDIPLTNFRGIELRDFSAEIARLALIIAEFQCDVLYRGQQEALKEFLPLDTENWITCGNALRLDWLSICPPTGTGVRLASDDLLETLLDQAEIDFENEGGETYICGNPPYIGATVKPKKGASTKEKEKLKREAERRKAELKLVFGDRTKTSGSLDYISGWFMKAADYSSLANAETAFVSTNSICQGQQVPILWPLIFHSGQQIKFAHTSFYWENLATNNAGVSVVIIGLSSQTRGARKLFSASNDGTTSVKHVQNINAYLVAGQNIVVAKRDKPFHTLHTIIKGNAPTDGGHLILSRSEKEEMESNGQSLPMIRRFLGSKDSINGIERYCLWLKDYQLSELEAIEPIRERLCEVTKMRSDSTKAQTKKLASSPHIFGETRQDGNERIVIIPRHSSERRDYLPFAVAPKGSIVADSASALYNAPEWNIAILTSRLHLIWIATVCGKIKKDYRYSNTLGWNTFPMPNLTQKNKLDLSICAENILAAREEFWPETIENLYDPEKMPDDLRASHERNDEVLERIYIGRRFKNDTERLEKLFELYTKMTTAKAEGAA